MARMAVSHVMTLTLLGNVALLTHANEFLKSPSRTLNERISEQDVRISLLDEVESSLGKGSTTKRLTQMETTLRPIVAALPKNEHGNLGHSAVRYALHRLFVLRHGWVIKGLGSEGGLYNSSSPAGVLKKQVPSFIEDMFERRLAGRGFGLHEVALLGATIEHLIHNEAVGKLGAVFNALELPVTSPITETETQAVLDTFMMAYILSESLENMTANNAQGLVTEMPEVFLAWQDTQKFVQDVRHKVISDDVKMDFASLAKIVEDVGEEFGSFQDLECQQMKDKLLKVEHRSTGRVKLSDFYKPALDGSWTFQESADYLRSQGILDESDPAQPSVMIANYVTSHTNCIASSGFYSVCCKNECEGLLGHIEESIGASEAKPTTITNLIANLSSSTVVVPPKLSTSLLDRLDEIAASHAGVVPLHGRLFAQWMHHIYPRECPYPHISGTADTKLPDEFADLSGSDATASEEEMMHYVSQATPGGASHPVAVEEVMPWSSEEELFVSQPKAAHSWLSKSFMPESGPVRSLVLLAAAGSLAAGMIQTLKDMPLGGTVPSKYTV